MSPGPVDAMPEGNGPGKPCYFTGLTFDARAAPDFWTL
jgi:hypothetical protein